MNNLPKEILQSLPYLEAKFLDKQKAAKILNKIEIEVTEPQSDSVTISLIKLIKVNL